jgi:hypothetical protein
MEISVHGAWAGIAVVVGLLLYVKGRVDEDRARKRREWDALTPVEKAERQARHNYMR